MDTRLLEQIVANGELIIQQETWDLCDKWHKQAEAALASTLGLLWQEVVIWQGFTPYLSSADLQAQLRRGIEAIRAVLRGPLVPVPHAADAPSHPTWSSGSSGRRAILAFAAMYEELQMLFDKRAAVHFPYDLRWKRGTLQTLQTNYWSAEIGTAHTLIAVTPDSMGLSDTAIVASAALLEFQPALTGMFGICAGRRDVGVRLGHVIVPMHAFHYQFGARELTGLRAEIRDESVNTRFTTAAQRIGSQKSFDAWMNEGHPKSIRPGERCECHTGPMACSDQVAKWNALVKQAADMDNKVAGIDMESYAFLRAARRCGLGNMSFVAKCVTDYADQAKGDSVREWAEVGAARFFYAMLVRWLDDVNHTQNWDATMRM